MFDDDGTDYGACGNLQISFLTGWTYYTTDDDFIDEPQIHDWEKRYAFLGFGNVHSASATSGQYGCATCLELDEFNINDVQNDNKGFAWCWGETSSTVGEETEWISYGNVIAMSPSSITLDTTGSWDPTFKFAQKVGTAGDAANHYRFASEL